MNDQLLANPSAFGPHGDRVAAFLARLGQATPAEAAAITEAVPVRPTDAFRAAIRVLNGAKPRDAVQLAMGVAQLYLAELPSDDPVITRTIAKVVGPSVAGMLATRDGLDPKHVATLTAPLRAAGLGDWVPA